jgi:hypothetical protein
VCICVLTSLMKSIWYVLSVTYQVGRRSDAVCGLLPASADQCSAQWLNTIFATTIVSSAPQALWAVPPSCASKTGFKHVAVFAASAASPCISK